MKNFNSQVASWLDGLVGGQMASWLVARWPPGWMARWPGWMARWPPGWVASWLDSQVASWLDGQMSTPHS